MIQLLEVDQVSDIDLMNIKQEFLKNKEIIHGCNGLTNFKEINQWRKYIQRLEYNPPKSQVKTKQFIISDNSRYPLGVIDFRFKLNDYLQKEGGHIGYSVRKNARGLGISKQALELLLEWIKKENILSEVLLTCQENNSFSKNTILACGGRLERVIVVNNKFVEHYKIKI
ncbi:GNAT family N-acetyltransferase [Vagococcus fluvialis]|uniref:GNAT family N-acetyltransferase n=1 Tax=Vagococcus fluvialis TaxID=2738 RepID=UPI003B5C837B